MSVSPLPRILCLLMLLIVLAAVAGCSTISNILPDGEFKALMVDADAAMQDANWTLATSKLEQAGRLKPGNLEVRYKQAQVYHQSGRLALAYNAYQTIIDTDPDAVGKEAAIVRNARKQQGKLGFRSAEILPERKTEQPPQETDPQTPAANSSEDQTPADQALDQQIAQPENVGDITSAVTDETEAQSSSEMRKPTAPEVNVQDIQPVGAKEVAAEEVAANNDQTEIELLLNRWQEAWQTKRVQSYLACYTETFSGGLGSPEKWRQQRKSRIQQAANIQIRLTNIQIRIKHMNQAEATFTQHYQSANHQDQGIKSLTLKKVGGLWLIDGEAFDPQ